MQDIIFFLSCHNKILQTGSLNRNWQSNGEKERNQLSVFTHDSILCVENYQEFTHTLHDCQQADRGQDKNHKVSCDSMQQQRTNRTLKKIVSFITASRE